EITHPGTVAAQYLWQPLQRRSGAGAVRIVAEHDHMPWLPIAIDGEQGGPMREAMLTEVIPQRLGFGGGNQLDGVATGLAAVQPGVAERLIALHRRSGGRRLGCRRLCDSCGRRLLDRLCRRRLLSDDRCGRRRHRRGFEGGWQGGGGRRDSAGLDRIVCAWIGDGGCRGSGDWRHLDLGLLLGVEQGGEQRADQDGQGGGNQQDGPVAAGFGAGRSWLGGGTEAAVQQALGFLVEACRYALSLIVDGPHFGGS